MRYKIKLERLVCTACGTCEVVCPKFWEMADDGFSHLIDSKKMGDNEELELDEIGCNVDAGENCPAVCIHIFDNGKEIT